VNLIFRFLLIRRQLQNKPPVRSLGARRAMEKREDVLLEEPGKLRQYLAAVIGESQKGKLPFLFFKVERKIYTSVH